MKRVVITGMGVISPIGNTINDFWKNMVSGKSGADEITKFNANEFKTQFACEVKDFHPEEYIDRREIKKYDLFTQYAIAASEQAIKDAKLDFDAMTDDEKTDIGVIWASGNGGIATFEEQLYEFHRGDGRPHFNPYMIPKMIADIAAGVISIRHKLYGPNYATVSACASSNTAIANAFDTIRLGKAKIMIAGGSEAAITMASVGGFNAAHALSKNNENFKTASRPFDKNRDGFVIGEGGGALILEDLENAQKRGAKIYAEIVGSGMAADAYHLTGTSPDGFGAYLGMKKALEEAQIKTTEIDYINAHATSTNIGDLSEITAIKRLFKNDPIIVTATKSITGHLLGAAGAVESIISILSINNNTIPATINTITLDEDIPESIQIVLEKSLEKEVKYVMNNTFGFGGHTVTTIFKKFII
ncbi:beta-ketoacyl-ACP synthase II [Flavobacterium sp. XS2P39]|uniref:beta-ketoacyl-ACP synthase II n=1 Tax=Flavobacterium sp. XS2P39 TaxID=3401725 RepID=UPI003AAB6DBF